MPPEADQPAALLLDMDGTLVQTEERWGVAERRLMTRLGGTWTDADQALALGGPLERVVAYMLGKTGGAHDHDEIMGALITFVEEEFTSAPLEWSAGILDLLKESHTAHIPVALVTASTARLTSLVVDALTAELGYAPFAAVVTADDVERGKPAPDPYALAAARVHVPASQCLAIEDSPTGVASATAAGCRVIGVEHMAPLAGVAVLSSLEGQTLNDLWTLVGRDSAQDR